MRSEFWPYLVNTVTLVGMESVGASKRPREVTVATGVRGYLEPVVSRLVDLFQGSMQVRRWRLFLETDTYPVGDPPVAWSIRQGWRVTCERGRSYTVQRVLPYNEPGTTTLHHVELELLEEEA